MGGGGTRGVACLCSGASESLLSAFGDLASDSVDVPAAANITGSPAGQTSAATGTQAPSPVSAAGDAARAFAAQVQAISADAAAEAAKLAKGPPDQAVDALVVSASSRVVLALWGQPSGLLH